MDVKHRKTNTAWYLFDMWNQTHKKTKVIDKREQIDGCQRRWGREVGMEIGVYCFLFLIQIN